MEKMTYGELTAKFRDHERNNPSTHLTGFIVFTEDSFEKSYSLEARTYRVSSDNKAYRPNMGGYSIFGGIWPPRRAAPTAGRWTTATWRRGLNGLLFCWGASQNQT